MLTFVLEKIQSDYFVLKLFQTSSILPLQAAKASQHQPDGGGLSITSCLTNKNIVKASPFSL
jgi:hypothetical protein